MEKENDKKRVCPHCGKEIDDNFNFCFYCGKKLVKKDSSVKKVIGSTKDKFKEIKESRSKKTYKNISPIVTAVITFVICLAAFGLFYNFYLKNVVIETTKLEKDVTVTDAGIADAVEKVYDSVVVVENYQKGNLYATGTGFVYKTDDDNGYILTNYHVINGATSVSVVLTNNERIEAKLVGGDEYSDVAVLSIDKSEVLAVADIGSSEDLRVGDTTFTVGAPVDSSTYSWSVTRGILSGKNRLVETSADSTSAGYVMEVLQTDAAINSGNSGGPLCNANGEVIGITNMKLSSSTIEGMGFAIPIEKAVQYADTFISGGTIARPYIGVSIYESTGNSFFQTLPTGIYVESVESGSPAAKAGLEKGDKIIKVNDEEVDTVAFFKYQLYKYDIGDKVKITYTRNNKEYTVEVTLSSLSENS